MNVLFLNILLLFLFEKIHTFEDNTTCPFKQVYSINECIKYSKEKNNEMNYCCMLKIMVGGNSKFMCVPVNSSNYEELKNKTDNLNYPFYLIDDRYKYKLYCNQTQNTFRIIFNYILYFLITILLI